LNVLKVWFWENFITKCAFHKIMKKVVFVFVLLLFSLSVVAQGDDAFHLKLLAVQENGDNFVGSDADLYLELKEGHGRVFLETKPATKIDTQISTRYAKEIACNHFKLNCDQYDFIYTIKSNSNIIGGPSAGAAISALTTIAVLDLKYDESITITGTINSGGTVGPVGGVKEKLEAASKAGLKKVIIAKGSGLPYPGIENLSTRLDLVEYGKENLSLEVIEVLDIDEVVFELTGKQLNHKEVILTEDVQYTKIMQNLQTVLCERNEKIVNEIKQQNIEFNNSLNQDKIESSQNASGKGDYYSAASFCFGSNIDLRSYYYEQKEPTINAVQKLFSELDAKNVALEKKLDEMEITTISDLQTKMVVKDRIGDVKRQIEEFNNTKDLSKTYKVLAYGEERFFSAVSWMEFFEMEGKEFMLDKDRIKNSCVQKISEAEERHQYTSLFVGEEFMKGINEKVLDARKAQENEEYELCMITSSQAKADSNAILSSLGLHNETIDEFITAKKKSVERIISQNSEEKVFPILGYSYYKYASTLQEAQPYNALVYLEYALEMSDLGIYFPEEKSYVSSFKIKDEWIYLMIGIAIGIGITVYFLRRR